MYNQPLIINCVFYKINRPFNDSVTGQEKPEINQLNEKYSGNLRPTPMS